MIAAVLSSLFLILFGMVMSIYELVLGLMGKSGDEFVGWIVGGLLLFVLGSLTLTWWIQDRSS